MNKRKFLKVSGLSALATFLAPAMWAAGAQEWPEYENGLKLRKVYRVGDPCKAKERVRMRSLKQGDIFFTDSTDGMFVADSDAFFNNESKSWAVAFSCLGSATRSQRCDGLVAKS